MRIVSASPGWYLHGASTKAAPATFTVICPNWWPR